MKRKKIKDYIKNSFIKYTVLIIILTLAVYLLTLYIIFNASIVKPNKGANEELTKKVNQEFMNYREGIDLLSEEEVIRKAVESGEVNNEVSQLLYDFRNERAISSNFVLMNRNHVVLSTSFYREDREKVENSYIVGDLINKLEKDGYIEQSLGNNFFSNTPYSTYFFSKAINEKGETVGYLFYFLDDFVEDTNNNQMIYVTDQYNNVVFNTHHFSIDRLGKLDIDPSKSVVNKNGNYYYLNSNVVDHGKIGIFTMTSVNIYRVLLIYGIVSMTVSSLIILLLAYILTPKILKRTLQPFDALVSIISSENNQTTINDNVIDELQTIYEEYKSKIKEIQDLIKVNKEITEKKRIIEIKHLEAKFNPHFLYNVLEMIKYEITLDPDNASEIIVKIAKLMRYNTNAGNTTVPLNTDLEYLKDYFSLQKMRYDSRLEYSIEVPSELLDIQIPKLIIQPLVENAIKHNIDKTSQLSIWLSVKKHGDNIVIKVKDDGGGIETDKLENLFQMLLGNKESTDHNGLKNTHNIIQLLYGKSYGLQIKSSINQGTTVCIKLPLIEVK